MEGQKVLEHILAPNSVTTAMGASSTAEPPRGVMTTGGHRRDVSSSSQFAPADVHVVTGTSESWSRDSVSPCHDAEDAVALSLWMQWTLLRLTGTLVSRDDSGHGEPCVCVCVVLFLPVKIQDCFVIRKCFYASNNAESKIDMKLFPSLAEGIARVMHSGLFVCLSVCLSCT